MLYQPIPLASMTAGWLPLLDQEQGAHRGDLHWLHRDLPRPCRPEGRVPGVCGRGEQENVGEIPDSGG